MVTAKITSNGRITIPKSVRESLHLNSGDTVAFVVRGDEAVLKPVTVSIDAVFGMLHRKGAPVLSVDGMNSAVKGRFVDCFFRTDMNVYAAFSAKMPPKLAP